MSDKLYGQSTALGTPWATPSGGASRVSAPGQSQVIQPLSHGGPPGRTNEGAAGTRVQAQTARSPSDYVVWGSVVSSPSGVWGAAPAAFDFRGIWRQMETISDYTMELFWQCFKKKFD